MTTKKMKNLLGFYGEFVCGRDERIRHIFAVDLAPPAKGNARMSKTKPDNPQSSYPALEELRQILLREQTLEEFRKRYGRDPSEPSRRTREREARKKSVRD
jgi:ribosomal protein S21